VRGECHLSQARTDHRSNICRVPCQKMCAPARRVRAVSCMAFLRHGFRTSLAIECHATPTVAPFFQPSWIYHSMHSFLDHSTLILKHSTLSWITSLFPGSRKEWILIQERVECAGRSRKVGRKGPPYTPLRCLSRRHDDAT